MTTCPGSNLTCFNGGKCVFNASAPASQNVSCSCACRWTGPTCEQFVEPDTATVVVVMILTLGICLGALAALVVHDRKTAYADWRYTRARATQSALFGKAMPLALTFAWRLFAFVWVLAVQSVQWSASRAGYSYRFFTIWNFFLLLVYFGLGAALTLVALMRPADGAKELSWVHMVHYAMFEIALPSACLVDIVLWGVLYPYAVTQGQGATLTNYTSVMQHAINLVLMLIEFIFFSSYALTPWHVALLAIWAGSYGVNSASVYVAGQCQTYVRALCCFYTQPAAPQTCLVPRRNSTETHLLTDVPIQQFFFNLSTPWSILWVLLIFALFLAFFGFWVWVSRPRCACCLGRRLLANQVEQESGKKSELRSGKNAEDHKANSAAADTQRAADRQAERLQVYEELFIS